MKDKGDSTVPGGFQHLVPQSLLVKAVVPLGKVTGTVGTFWRQSNLSAIYTATAVKPNITTKEVNPLDSNSDSRTERHFVAYSHTSEQCVP